MATASQIQLALANARAADISYSDMALLLKHALLGAMLDGSGSLVLPWQTTASDGTSITRMAITEARLLLEFLQANANGGVVVQYGEFRNPR